MNLEHLPYRLSKKELIKKLDPDFIKMINRKQKTRRIQND